jgi:hypothetical protein
VPERLLGWVLVSGLFGLLLPSRWWVLVGPVAFEASVTIDNLVRLGTVWSRNSDLRHRPAHRIIGVVLIVGAVAGCVALGVTGHVLDIALIVVPAAVIAWTDWLRSSLGAGGAVDFPGDGKGGPSGDRSPRLPGGGPPALAVARDVPKDGPGSPRAPLDLGSDGEQSRP